MNDDLPLRYPGGKRKLAGYVAQFARSNKCEGHTLIEVFAGSAAVSIKLLKDNIVSDVILVEADPLVSCFWKAVQFDNDRLVELVKSTPINLSTWAEAKQLLKLNYIPLQKDKVLEAGFSFLLLNRTCFSGLITSGPIGGKTQSSAYPLDCRFNRSRIISSLRGLKVLAPKVHLINGDGVTFLTSLGRNVRENSFLYIDPPYYVQGPKLYRHHFNDDQHECLANAVKSISSPWLMSYDDAPEIRSLYGSSEVLQVHFDYSMRTTKKCAEVLISNRTLPPLFSIHGGQFYPNEQKEDTAKEECA